MSENRVSFKVPKNIQWIKSISTHLGCTQEEASMLIWRTKIKRQIMYHIEKQHTIDFDNLIRDFFMTRYTPEKIDKDTGVHWIISDIYDEKIEKWRDEKKLKKRIKEKE